MKGIVIASLIAQFTFICSARGQQFPAVFSIPVDTFWGVEVKDPFRWLESLRSDATEAWLKKQERLCRAQRFEFQSTYMRINEKFYTHGSATVPWSIHKGSLYFRFKYHNEYSSPVLYFSTKDENIDRIAYDPNFNYSKEPILINDFFPSNDSRYLAVALSRAGSDWVTIKVRDLSTGLNLEDKIEWVKFTDVIWTDEGFFYSRFKEPPQGQMYTAVHSDQILYHHRLGDPQEKDKPMYAVPKMAGSTFGYDITSDKRHLILYSSTKTGTERNRIIGYKDLSKGLDSELKLIISTPERKKYDFKIIDLVGNHFLVQSNFDAPRNRVLKCHKDSINQLTPLIPQFEENLESVHHFGGRIVTKHTGIGTVTLGVFNYQGELLKALRFPEGINVSRLQGHPTDSIMKYIIFYFYAPPIVFSLNLNSFSSELVKKTEIHYDASRYTTRVVTFESKDGTKVPMYLTHRKGLIPDPSHPVILQGYGGFGVSMVPYYSFTNILLFENDGILAVPMLRGGGEFGENWHEQGKRLNKQNTFDDFISAAEFLIDSGFTSKERLAIKGGSNGGLVVGATLTQRPDLFSVAIGEVGAYDMLRFHKFTTGPYHKGEFGTVLDSVDFPNLLSYSPLHNVKKDMHYPATLLTTSEFDDRLPPFHTYKFLAALQENSMCCEPHILYFEEDAGHQGSENIDDYMKKEAFILGFIFHQMNIRFKSSF